jgi:MFS superfamily sulfate permease-like transporter
VLSLVDFSILKKTWTYSRADFAAVSGTILLTLGLGVEVGVSAGVALSILIHLYKTSRPHVAEVGQVPGTEHFRNVKRHKVETDEPDADAQGRREPLFRQCALLEDSLRHGRQRPQLKHVVLMCPAVNEIDMSALESLEAINERLKSLGVTFHLSEVKGPVMDRLRRGDFLASPDRQGVPQPASGDQRTFAAKTFPNQHHNNQTRRFSMTIRIGDTAPNFQGRHHQRSDRFSRVDRLVLGVLLQPSG